MPVDEFYQSIPADYNNNTLPIRDVKLKGNMCKRENLLKSQQICFTNMWQELGIKVVEHILLDFIEEEEMRECSTNVKRSTCVHPNAIWGCQFHF